LVKCFYLGGASLGDFWTILGDFSSTHLVTLPTNSKCGKSNFIALAPKEMNLSPE
jgi:hypothetical protein